MLLSRLPRTPSIELRRRPIPRTRVNKGKKAQTGHGRMLTKALKEVPSIEPAGAGKTAIVRRGRITTACTGNESPVGGRASTRGEATGDDPQPRLTGLSS